MQAGPFVLPKPLSKQKQMRDQITWKAVYRRAVAVKATCFAEALAKASFCTCLILHAVFQNARALRVLQIRN